MYLVLIVLFAAAPIPKSTVDCRHSSYWCTDVDTDINNWTTSEKVGFAIGISLAGITVGAAILVVVAAFRKRKSGSDIASGLFFSSGANNNNELASAYDYQKIDDGASLQSA